METAPKELRSEDRGLLLGCLSKRSKRPLTRVTVGAAVLYRKSGMARRHGKSFHPHRDKGHLGRRASMKAQGWGAREPYQVGT